ARGTPYVPAARERSLYTDTHTISLAGVAVEEGPQADIGLAWASLSPNPVRDVARAELVLESPMNVEVHVVDGRGRRVRVVSSEMRPAGTSGVEVDVRGLAPGTYFLVAETERGRRTQAMSVVR
ncbi:MAG: T9SS type A sorting domain-containing protein, partial [Bacteroidota bacterium]